MSWRRSASCERQSTEPLTKSCLTWRVVGSAMAMMRMRAQRYALVSPVAHADQILSDLVCAETAEIILQPLSEGLALFAEFDITPAAGRVYSRTTAASMICFGVALEGGGGRHSPMDIMLAGLLQTTRRRREFLERKAGIYAMPYEYEHGYLSGYLSAKALWAALAPRSKSLADRDTFLAFIRSWIYSDAGLALAIVTGHADHIRASERIVQRVYDRFAHLIGAPDLAAIVDRWERAVDANEPVATALGLNDEEHREAEEAVFLLNRDVNDEGPISDFAAHAFSTLLERKYVTLGSLPATALSRAAGVDIEAANMTTSYGVVAGMPEGRVQGEIHIVMPSRMNCLLIYLVSDGGTHLLKASGSPALTVTSCTATSSTGRPTTRSTRTCGPRSTRPPARVSRPSSSGMSVSRCLGTVTRSTAVSRRFTRRKRPSTPFSRCCGRRACLASSMETMRCCAAWPPSAWPTRAERTVPR
ncbi:hypothetical protein J7E70_34320 [Variovorax paradoxus]|nr:hypothetical protein [Variovorax paradoxus]MBT2305471.1 hypothetical protein [Variovorax paradoxus]